MNATDVARLKYCPLKDVAAGAIVPFWDSYTKEIHGETGCGVFVQVCKSSDQAQII